MKNLLFLFILLLLIFFRPVPSQGAEQAEQAIRSIKKLIATGQIPPDSILKIVVKQGNINNYWGNDQELKREWENQTGIRLDAGVRPQLADLEFFLGREDFDITVARNRSYADLLSQGLIEDLTPLMEKFGPPAGASGWDGFFLPRLQAWYAGRLVAIPADGDIALLYLRNDLLTDQQQQRKYLQRFNHRLEVPQTWDEYQQQVEFFHSTKDGFFGNCEQREELTAWMLWMPRYASQAIPNQFLFDEQMHPLINSPAGIDATENYLATIPFAPPEILKMGNDYSYSLPVFLRGHCYSFILTPAGAKLFNLDNSDVKGKFITSPLPGTRINGKLIRRSTFIYGNNLVISAKSKQKELSYLYLLWLSDPDISARSVAVLKGFADPYRYNHLQDAKVIASYTEQALEALAESIPLTVPAGTGLPGDSDYLAALDHNLLRAGRREISAAQAMQETALAWEQITERFGRDKQIHFWKNFRQQFPTAVTNR